MDSIEYLKEEKGARDHLRAFVDGLSHYAEDVKSQLAMDTARKTSLPWWAWGRKSDLEERIEKLDHMSKSIPGLVALATTIIPKIGHQSRPGIIAQIRNLDDLRHIPGTAPGTWPEVTLPQELRDHIFGAIAQLEGDY